MINDYKSCINTIQLMGEYLSQPLDIRISHKPKHLYLAIHLTLLKLKFYEWQNNLQQRQNDQTESK